MLTWLSRYFSPLWHHSRTSYLDTSQHNGRVEGKLHHILDTIRELTTATSTPSMLSTPLIGVLHLSYNTKHLCCMTQLIIRAFLKFLVYECFVLLQPHECIKLQPHSQLCCFLGYGIEQKGHKSYDPIAKRLWISRHVVFWEHKMFYTLSISWILLLQLSMWILF